MNRRGDKGFHVPRKMPNRFKDKEEELSFFRDIQKLEKERSLASFLQPVSEEFEANGNYGFYTSEPGNRRNPGIEFLAAENGKSDYNWLKTPPATPLFPSLEMEANAQEQVIHKELPIFQPLSRFAGNLESNRTSNLSSASSNPKLIPLRHKTPTGKSSISSSKDKKNMKMAPILNSKTNQKVTNHQDNMKQAYTHIIKSNVINNKEIQSNFLASNLSKSIGKDTDSNARPKSRGISPFARQSVPIRSDETPDNLRSTYRSASANRGRPAHQNTPQKQDSITISTKTRRQSCSPSVTRGQKMETIDGNNVAPQNSSTNRKVQQARNNQAQVLGSRMVDKLMNARTSYKQATKTKF